MISNAVHYEAHLLRDGGWCPNNQTLPVLVYRSVHATTDDATLAEWFEGSFGRHGWPPAWRYTIYPYAHYHSTAHEVIGIYRGSAQIRIGDAVGLTIHCVPGDVLLIPAGVSHERLLSSPDFHGVGAYPLGFMPDEMRGRPGEKTLALRRLGTLPVPPLDPIAGEDGPLHAEWLADHQTASAA